MRVLLASFALIATTAAAQAQAVTTRIETRPYYGAITTVEHGVRVTRALPAHDRIIINPQGKAPVSFHLGDSDGQTVLQQNFAAPTVAPAPSGAYYGVPLAGPKYWKRVPAHGVPRVGVRSQPQH